MVDKAQRILLDCNLHKRHTYQCGIAAVRSQIWSAFIGTHSRYTMEITHNYHPSS